MKYGKLTLLSKTDKKPGIHWKMQCDCGEIEERSARDVRASVKRGCEPCCLKCKSIISAINGRKNKSHGFSTSMPNLYDVYRQMIYRCYNESSKDYKNYGGRGIVVCDEWLNSISSFMQWAISSGYKKGITLERVNVNGNYEPSNCTWIANELQAKNTRKATLVIIDECHMTLPDAAKYKGISERTLKTRLRLNWSLDDALNVKPVLGRNQYGLPK